MQTINNSEAHHPLQQTVKHYFSRLYQTKFDLFEPGTYCITNLWIVNNEIMSIIIK